MDKTTIVLKQMLGWEGEYSILHSCRLSSNRAAILGWAFSGLPRICTRRREKTASWCTKTHRQLYSAYSSTAALLASVYVNHEAASSFAPMLSSSTSMLGRHYNVCAVIKRSIEIYLSIYLCILLRDTLGAD